MKRHRIAAPVLVGCAMWTAPATGQIANDFVVTANHPVTFDSMVYRFNDRLEPLGGTNVDVEGDSSMGGIILGSIDGNGVRAFPWDPLAFVKILRVDRNGAVLPSIILGHNAMSVLTGANGQRFALTRIPLQTAGPVYGTTTTSVLWSSWAASYAVNAVNTAVRLGAVAPDGTLWLTGLDSGACLCNLFGFPQSAAIDPLTGSVIKKFHLPAVDYGTGAQFAKVAPDGTLWMGMITPTAVRSLLHTTTSGTVLMNAPYEGGGNASTEQHSLLRNEFLLTPSTYNPAGNYTKRLLKCRLSDGGTAESFEFPALVTGFDVRGDGEVVYVFTAGFDLPNYRIHRLNLRTRASSYFGADTLFQLGTANIPFGDLTGYVFANVTNRGNDNDGDGIANGLEVDARSNPFDPESRPTGPRVGVTFVPTTNALRLNIEDPDGLLDPIRGIDVSTLSVTASGVGEIFPLLLPFLSSVTLSSDGRSADLEFGLLPIPSNLKIRIEASVRDKTGARGSDWQATPPGALN